MIETTLAFLSAFYPSIFLRMSFSEWQGLEKRFLQIATLSIPVIALFHSPLLAFGIAVTEFFSLYLARDKLTKISFKRFFNARKSKKSFKQLLAHEEDVEPEKMYSVFPNGNYTRVKQVKNICKALQQSEDGFHAARIWKELEKLYGEQEPSKRIETEKWISEWLKESDEVQFKEKEGRKRIYVLRN